MLIDSTAVKAHLCAAGGERGEQSLAIGRLRSGLTTKIHAFTARFCPPPLAFLLTDDGRAHRDTDSILAACVAVDAEATRQQWRRVADQLRPKVPELAALMEGQARRAGPTWASRPITWSNCTRPVRWSA